MNFAILNNGKVTTFSNNVIAFPSSTNDQYVLTRENINGTITYSWNTPLEGGSVNLDFVSQNAEFFITTTKRNIDSKGHLLVFDIEVINIPELCNNYDDVIIYVNKAQIKITPWLKHIQIVVDNDEQNIIISSNVVENYIQLKQLHLL